ncbi:hypothetical protein X754_22075 [Mesorhizobium sp. LNJC403B00]|nr:hypothetical protein X754_22075 [Mesorhizobium sp. LNJC403B00]
MMARRPPIGAARSGGQRTTAVHAHQPEIGWMARRVRRSVDELLEATN